MISQASKMGIQKVNIDTDIRLAMTAIIRQTFFDNPEAFDPRKYLKPARQAVQDMVAHKLDILGNIGRI